MTTPRFEKPKRGHAWAPAVKAFVITTAETVETWEDFTAKLEATARWAGGIPSTKTLRTWTNDAGLALPSGQPGKSARKAEGAAIAREARFERLADKRDRISELLGARAIPKAAELLVKRLDEQDEVEARVADRKARLDEALLLQRALADDASREDKAAVRREVVLNRVLLELEKQDRIPVVDLMRIITHGVQRHLELEGLAQAAGEDDDHNPIIVEVTIPRAVPGELNPVQQHELPERT